MLSMQKPSSTQTTENVNVQYDKNNGITHPDRPRRAAAAEAAAAVLATVVPPLLQDMGTGIPYGYRTPDYTGDTYTIQTEQDTGDTRTLRTQN